jgi:hypothetical protein
MAEKKKKKRKERKKATYNLKYRLIPIVYVGMQRIKGINKTIPPLILFTIRKRCM